MSRSSSLKFPKFSGRAVKVDMKFPKFSGRAVKVDTVS